MERDITLVFGKTGMGKTQWTKRHIRSLKRAIIIDPLDEYEGRFCDDPGILLEWGEKNKLFRARTACLDRFDDVCLVASVLGNTTLVIEEAQRIMPAGSSLPETFENIIYRGRHSRTSLIIISQRPTTVHIAARSQWTRIISFAQTEKADTTWLRAVTGQSVMFESLTPLEYYDITPASMERRLLNLNAHARAEERQ